ncbi:MAG: hypothetical protein WBG38_02230 [Nodosilinea sp.]
MTGLLPLGTPLEDARRLLLAIWSIALPCVVEPIMSSSGKCQSTVQHEANALATWTYLGEAGWGKSDRVIQSLPASCGYLLSPPPMPIAVWG